MSEGKWTREEVELHIKNNIGDPYSAAVLVGAFFKVLYGDYPKIGLSGYQASGIDFLAKKIKNNEVILDLLNTLRIISNLRNKDCILHKQCTCFADIAFLKLKEFEQGKKE